MGERVSVVNGRWAGRVPSFWLAAALTLTTARVGATPPVDRARAREAYDLGVAAYQRRDFATAARELARADLLSPNAVTLRAALEAALAADDPALGLELCDRAERAPSDAVAALVRDARARFTRRAGRVRITCPAGATCSATLDGAPIGVDRPVHAAIGRHVVFMERDGHAEKRAVDVTADGEVALAAPDDLLAPIHATKQPPAGPSLGWFFAALGGTAITAGVTVGSAVDTAGKYRRFVDAGCAGSTHGDCSGLASDGLDAQRRTNVLIGVTAALGATAAVVGVLTFRARSGERVALWVGGGPVAMIRLPFP